MLFFFVNYVTKILQVLSTFSKIYLLIKTKKIDKNLCFYLHQFDDMERFLRFSLENWSKSRHFAYQLSVKRKMIL